LYDEICHQGIMEKLRSPQNIGGNRFDEEEVAERLIEAMECYAIKLALCSWASTEIADAESAHFSGLAMD